MSLANGLSATVSVRVVPRSTKEGVAGFEGGVVKIRLNAPPVEGKANEALGRFLAKAVGVQEPHHAGPGEGGEQDLPPPASPAKPDGRPRL